VPICDGNAVPGKRSVLARVTFARWLCRSPAAAMLAMGLLASSPLSAQTITIDSVPPYGAPGSISGTVTGVNFAQHRVAVYIHIEGVGWWTKPGAANPTVPIQPNGAFTANVYTCCLDDRATIFYAALIPSAVTPPLASAACAVPPGLQAVADHWVDRPGRTIQFANRTWAVKDSPAPAGPGGNLFSDDLADVFVDPQGRLHLRVVQRGGQWWCSEVVLMDDVGHGTYWFTTESQVGSLDPNLTFGAFTWDSFCDDTTIPAWPNREIDFEDSRWGNPGDPNSSQVVVQPWSVSGNMVRYSTPPLQPSPTLTRFFTWAPDRIDFGVGMGRRSPSMLTGTGVIHTSSYVHNPALGHRVPPAGRQKWRFNLWINQGGAPSNGQTAEVIISDFRFSPILGAFPGGCRVNPAGSASILSGAPALGTTITLGFDNPAGTQTPGSFAGLIVGTPTQLFPCGYVRPGWGMNGPVGELLLDPALPITGVLGGQWSGPGSPVPFPLTIPNASALVGVSVYTQGVLLDPFGAVPIGLADGFELTIQP